MKNNVEALRGDYLLYKMNTFITWLFYCFPLKPFVQIRMQSQTEPANHVGADYRSIILMHLLFGPLWYLNLGFAFNIAHWKDVIFVL